VATLSKPFVVEVPAALPATGPVDEPFESLLFAEYEVCVR
jgi:hypothetical protein